MSSTNIRYACEGDTPGLSKINIDAFSNTGKFITNTFPGASRDSLIVYKGAVAVKHLADPKKHVLAAVELSTGEIVGYTRWEIPRGIGYDHDMPPLSEKGTYALENQMEFAPKPMNEELYNAFKRFLEQKRKQFATDDDLVLDFLATSPAHQGKGIGSSLLKWGLQKADSLKRRTYLEGTTEGYPLYLKYGFKTVEESEIDFTPYGGEGFQKFFIMIRDPQ